MNFKDFHEPNIFHPLPFSAYVVFLIVLEKFSNPRPNKQNWRKYFKRGQNLLKNPWQRQDGNFVNQKKTASRNYLKNF